MDNSIPWIEKYRPTKLSEIIMDKKTAELINCLLANDKNTHFILTGEYGTGKTSTIKCIAKHILGDNINEGYMELNAADDRGIKTISQIIPPFCKRIVNYKGPKIILLDEADNMTAECQNIMISLIQRYGDTTRFMFTCNNSKKINEDIQSVCTILRFNPLHESQILEYLEKICIAENKKYTLGGLKLLCHIASGDMRKAINNLQLVSYTFDSITRKNVLEISKIPNPDIIKEILKLCLEQKLNEANNSIMLLVDDGFCYNDIVSTFIEVLDAYEIDNVLKHNLIQVAQQTKLKLMASCRSKLQLTSMICKFIEEIRDTRNKIKCIIDFN